ncbi:hypothetical protein [Pseudoxanthomonas dokdonensis]|uniref:Uncharacterized protein n=1 Tax=Pseudoxanthomonas dokdonensis TaxID=344882 RepID=A0A0R0D0I1_9GAMM|nr:hypothetical protein [Pseudoxanthomonas dokdonensis]KRG70904.1 hypothetical protein ABB29_03445 [Pseudoxanthomonas dokdonensis]
MGTTIAAVVTVLSALALYLGSPNCVWNRTARPRPAWSLAGGVAAVAGLLLWIWLLGAGAGISVALATWMLALVLLPYLACWLVSARGNVRNMR